MKQNKSVITALGLTGLLGLSVTPGWSQTKSGSSPAPTSPGSSQKDEGTSPSGSRAGQMKSGTTPTGTESGDQTSARGHQESPGSFKEQRKRSRSRRWRNGSANTKGSQGVPISEWPQGQWQTRCCDRKGIRSGKRIFIHGKRLFVNGEGVFV